MLRLLLLIVWVIQLALVLLLVDATWIEEQVTAEQDQLERHLGEQRARRLLADAHASFEDSLMATGIVQQSYATLLPDSAVPKQGMENVAPWFFAWIEARLDAIWLSAFQAIVRVLLLREWLDLLLVGSIVALLDGYIQQRVKRANNELASADRYLIGRQAALVAAALPFFYVVVPISTPPSFIPAWVLLTAVIFHWLLAHAQHRL